jgi:hypothetical protein
MKVLARMLASSAVLALALVPRMAAAQNAPASADITPYAGWLITGNFLEGPLGVSLSTAGGPMYGVQASIPLAPGISLFGNLASSKADLSIGVPFVGGVSVGEVQSLLYDGGVRLAMPGTLRASSSITPFVQLGVGAMRHVISASVLETKTTNLAFNAGVGAHVHVTDGIGLRVMASDYIGRFDSQEAIALDLDSRTTHNFGFVGGLSISF